MKIKNLIFIFCLILTPQITFSQESIPNKQFMLACTDVGSSEEVTHYINAFGEVWQYSSGSFITGGVYSSSLVTIGNVDYSSNNWPGFNFNLLYGEPHWSLGIYKVSNSKQTNKYFYLDARDSDFGSRTGDYSPPDFFVKFNNDEGIYDYTTTPPTSDPEWTGISNGIVVRIWDIFNQVPNTSGLQNYGAMCLW